MFSVCSEYILNFSKTDANKRDASSPINNLWGMIKVFCIKRCVYMKVKLLCNLTCYLLQTENY